MQNSGDSMLIRALGAFGVLLLLLAATSSVVVIIVDALEMVDGNLCNTQDGANVLVQEITTSRDATIFQGQDTLSAGEDQFMVGTTKNGIRRGLLAFDFQADDFPSDAKVECVELRLRAVVGEDNSVSFPEITLHQTTSAWTTSGLNRLTGINGGGAKPGDTTWLYTDYPTSVWKERGGDFDATVVATKVAFGNVHSFGNTREMTRLVQNWIDVGVNPFNAGFLFVGEENLAPSEKYVRYSGIENAPALIPRLIVTYTSPSQGKEHREYMGYTDDEQKVAVSPPSSSSSSSSSSMCSSNSLQIAATDGLFFMGGVVFGALGACFIFFCRGKGHGKKEATEPEDPGPISSVTSGDQLPQTTPEQQMGEIA